jgi:diketogulonate reductase-like aldo/keto reductase
VQRGTSIIPKSNKSERILLNARLLNLDLADVATIGKLRDQETSMRMNDCKNHIGFDIYNEEVEEPVDL